MAIEDLTWKEDNRALRVKKSLHVNQIGEDSKKSGD